MADKWTFHMNGSILLLLLFIQLLQILGSYTEGKEGQEGTFYYFIDFYLYSTFSCLCIKIEMPISPFSSSCVLK